MAAAVRKTLAALGGPTVRLSLRSDLDPYGGTVAEADPDGTLAEEISSSGRVSPDRTRVAAALKTVLAAVGDELPDALAAANAAGYELILGLFDDKSQNVYRILALSKKPSAWEPYRAPSQLTQSDSVALLWWFDEELTSQNVSGDMVYEPGGDAPVNVPKYESAGLGDLEDAVSGLSEQARREVLDRIVGAASGSVADRWNAPRA